MVNLRKKNKSWKSKILEGDNQKKTRQKRQKAGNTFQLSWLKNKIKDLKTNPLFHSLSLFCELFKSKTMNRENTVLVEFSNLMLNIKYMSWEKYSDLVQTLWCLDPCGSCLTSWMYLWPKKTLLLFCCFNYMDNVTTIYHFFTILSHRAHELYPEVV